MLPVLTPEEIAIKVALLTAEREALRRAARTGILKIEHGDKRMTYRSMADLVAAISDIGTELDGLLCAPRRKRARYFSVSKGL